jgi:AbrB family looped-hinge helix DNA binding protein
MVAIMRITSKGQVTIPLAIRRKIGLLPNTEVDFIVKGNTVQIVKSADPDKSRGKKLVARMRGKATVKMSTDQIMALTRGEE